MPQKIFFSLKEAAEYLGISYRTIRRLVKDNKLPALQVGHQWRIKISDLEEYVSKSIRQKGLVGAKPLFFNPLVLERYKKDKEKYYIFDQAFHGKFGIRSEWYNQFFPATAHITTLKEVPYRKVKLKSGMVVINIDTDVYYRTIAESDEHLHWLKHLIHQQ
ncbi:MAG: helix-turn-helix domain-containing protein [Planctomycetota bacterium]